MKEQLINAILNQLEENSSQLQEKFHDSINEVGVRYFVLDDLLPASIAHQIFVAFPTKESMRFFNNLRERKYTSKNFEKFNSLLMDITFAFQDPRIVAKLEKITSISEQVPDPHLYAGGLSAMDRGSFLRPHIDNSHDRERKKYRTLNLLYYITPDWKIEFGGNLELWNSKVSKNITVESIFNRLVIMETNPWSWHSVSKVKVDRLRCCVSNYYFSEVSPTGENYFNVTSFSARPEQKLLRSFLWLDKNLRTAVRYVRSRGFGRDDIYKGPA